ncbi:LOW QUALITY PROTEIN: lon protease homolog 1, mitochondrial [Capsella rubella]|uniref:LOW QUALITY PROTEIN: lon protease homolog 1, mitochondrial n=1 Tax=Capsella rubella TaxID=81985 RepID=UPI000CD5C1E6|nr:LOW QUALITY PROTEIN: lon protease homolog 1, mitochondrial [Capsella rubella]
MINLIVVSSKRLGKEIELNKLKIPKRVLQVIDEELTKLEVFRARKDLTIARNYLDWLTVLPWGIAHVIHGENCDVISAGKILDEDHYGLSNIICLTGPPGVGKTSMARSIARALHHNFFKFSVGGLIYCCSR